MKLSDFTRRQFINTGVVGAGAMLGVPVIPDTLNASKTAYPLDIPVSIQDSKVKELVQRCLDSAVGAGASYADARITIAKTRVKAYAAARFAAVVEVHQVGVRALVNGFWGFAASNIWSDAEMDRLGTSAAKLASVNAIGKPREFHMAPLDQVQNGHWEAPVEIDPFAMHPLDLDYSLKSIVDDIRKDIDNLGRYTISSGRTWDGSDARFKFVRTEKAFGSTDGSFVTQKLSRMEGYIRVVSQLKSKNETSMGQFVLSPSMGGWELVQNSPILEAVIRDYENNLELSKLPLMPLDVGMHEVLFDAKSVASLVSATIGTATELDRAIGEEANGVGTSYLNDPEAMISTYQIGTPDLTVTANRTQHQGLASIGWDDEGIVPEDITLVKNGILNDFQTSREGAGWLRDAYNKLGRPFRSHGNMFSNTALDSPKIHTANLVMDSGARSDKYDDLEKGLEKGFSIVGMQPNVDFGLTGVSTQDSFLRCYEVRNGRKTAFVPMSGVLLRTSELWKNIIAMGGRESLETYGIGGFLEGHVNGYVLNKGDPERDRRAMPLSRGMHSVSAVPVVVKDVPMIDRARR